MVEYNVAEHLRPKRGHDDDYESVAMTPDPTETYCQWQHKPDPAWPERPFWCPECDTRRKVRVVRVCRSEAAQQKAIAEHQREKEAKHRVAVGIAPDVVLTFRHPAIGYHNYTLRDFWYCPGLKPLRWAWAMVRFVVHSIRHRRWQVRSRAEYQRVRAICESCPSDRWDAAKQECQDCGCAGRSKLVLLNKLMLTTESCPRRHWENEVEAEPVA